MPKEDRKEPILDSIHNPSDLRGLSLKEIEKLAVEIRERIIQTVSAKGGHFGASMGAVDITLALHKVFRAPQDIFLWDVGHQTYPHKIITGRNDRFETIRQWGGLSGFPRRDESPFDAFGAAHAGTALSAAVGYALARDLRGENHKVIAVVGDAGIVNGMTFEAMNHLGHLEKDVLVVLNDNKMSISPTVGAMNKYLNRIITGEPYQKLKTGMNKVLHSVPTVGDSLARAAKHLEGSMKSFMGAGGFFEELGFTYVGPVDGHNMEVLLETLEKIKGYTKPTLLHVVTVKGKGYKPAEEKPVVWHGVTPFKAETGEIMKKSGGPVYTSVFAKKLSALADKDDKIVAITAAMMDGTGLTEFAKNHADRCIDVGIAEEHAITMAAGLACGGMKPVAAIYSTFLQRAYDQIIHDVCLQDLSVVFVLDRAGIVGDDGETHQGMFDLTYLRPLPGMRIMAPSCAEDLEEMMELSLSRNDGPIAIRIPRGTCPKLPLPRQPVAWGRGAVLRPGKDLVILAVGSSVIESLQAAELMMDQAGLSVQVVDLRFVKPLDQPLIHRLAVSFEHMVTVEENAIQGGMGSAVLEYLAQVGLNPKVLRMALPDKNIKHGSQAQVRGFHNLDASGIAKSALQFVKGEKLTLQASS